MAVKPWMPPHQRKFEASTVESNDFWALSDKDKVNNNEPDNAEETSFLEQVVEDEHKSFDSSVLISKSKSRSSNYTDKSFFECSWTLGDVNRATHVKKSLNAYFDVGVPLSKTLGSNSSNISNQLSNENRNSSRHIPRKEDSSPLRSLHACHSIKRWGCSTLNFDQKSPISLHAPESQIEPHIPTFYLGSQMRRVLPQQKLSIMYNKPNQWDHDNVKSLPTQVPLHRVRRVPVKINQEPQDLKIPKAPLESRKKEFERNQISEQKPRCSELLYTPQTYTGEDCEIDNKKKNSHDEINVARTNNEVESLICFDVRFNKCKPTEASVDDKNVVSINTPGQDIEANSSTPNLLTVSPITTKRNITVISALSKFEANYKFDIPESAVRKDLVSVSAFKRSVSYIKKWAKLQPKRHPRITGESLLSNDQHDIGDFYWQQYDSIESSHRDAFWKLCSTNGPLPVEEQDLNVTPWWYKYKNANSMYLQSLDHPDTRLDPGDIYSDYVAKEPTTNDKCKQRIRECAIKTAMDLKQPIRNAWLAKSFLPAMNSRLNRASIEIELRSATFQDLEQLVILYNRNIQHSWGLIDIRPVDFDLVQHRFDSLSSKQLPFIVAIRRDSGKPIPGRGLIESYASSGTEEEVVGYAMADDYADSGSLYHNTAELEIHVRHEYRDLKIGKVLLDHILYIIDKDHVKRTKVAWADETCFALNGSTRKFRTVIFNVLYAPKSPHGDMKRFRLLRGWLERWGFRMTTEIPQVACRDAIWLDAAQIYRHCNSSDYEKIQRIPQNAIVDWESEHADE